MWNWLCVIVHSLVKTINVNNPARSHRLTNSTNSSLDAAKLPTVIYSISNSRVPIHRLYQKKIKRTTSFRIVSYRSGTSAEVPARRLPTSLRRRVTASSPICWSATAERAAAEEYICPAGFLCGWSVGVELVAGLPERPGSQQRHFLQAPKDVFVRGALIHTPH